MTTIHEVAAKLAEMVEGNLPPSPGVATRDWNDELLCAAYGRAFRCFRSIRELAARDEADDALVLTRTLLLIALRSLYIALPDDPTERQKRQKSSGLTSMKAELTATAEQAAAGFNVSDRNVEVVERGVDRLEKEGVRQLPPEEQIAKAVGFDAFYPRVFRPTSAIAHYSIWSALDGFIELGVPTISLDLPAPERAQEALELATVVYGAFLEKSDPIIKHGVSSAAHQLMDEYMEEHHR
jgi:Family of unknown function (DUF5677)